MKKFIKSISILLASILLISGCSGNKQTDSGKNLVVSQFADAVTLDPHKTNDAASATPMKQIYNTLIALDDNMQPAPSLATEWKALDDFTWEFKLAKGVKFHNGEEMKASDVEFTIKRFINPETATVAGFMLSSVSDVKVIDDYTVQLITKVPFASIIYNLTHVSTSILNEKAVTEAGNDYGIKPVGTGPFKFVEWKRNQEIVMEKNEDYFMPPTQIDKITFRIIPEGATSFSELKTGGVDVVLDVQTQYKEQFDADQELELIDFLTFSTRYLAFDHRQEPFNDVRVRKAVNYATDKDAIIRVAYDGNADILAQPMTPKINGYDDTIKPYEYDVEKAKQLLAEAGYPDGFSSILYLSDKEEDNKLATILQSQLKEVGINVDLQVLEWGAYLDKVAEGVPMFLLGWTTVTADADNGMYSNFHSSAFGKQGNRIYYNNPVIDDLLDKGRTEFDSQKRTDNYKEVSKIVSEDAVWDFLVMKKYLVGTSKKVKNFKPSPTTIFDFYSVTIE